ncbi:MAG: sugar ABC transporter ATP-binding protein [Beutenbergiaceae bacterium]
MRVPTRLAAGRDFDQDAIVSASALTVEYPGVRALDAVNFDVQAGEIVGLIGENGAGKSTLVSILAGLRPEYRGEVRIDGSVVDLHSPVQSKSAGIALAQQELSLIPDLSVAENIMLGRLPRKRMGLVDRQRANERAGEALSSLDVDIPLGRLVRQLSPAQAQLVEIAKCLAGDPRLLILDEPTSSLSSLETRKLLKAIKNLRAHGVAVLYISHKLDEVLELTDRVTVLRDGQKVDEGPTTEWDEERMIRAMVGRDLSQMFQRRPHEPGELVLELDGLSSRGTFEDVSLTLRQGEVLGLAGLVGAGRTEIAETIFGLRPATAGTVYVDGEPVTIRSPHQAVRRGIALVTEDRRGTGIVGDLGTQVNMALASLERRTRLQFVQHRTERDQAIATASRLHLAAGALPRSIRTLSGGNQQKAVLGKWLMSTPRILILDEPTRGVDVGAKSEIYTAIDSLTRDGMAVLLISSEMPEILGLCDRVAVIRAGRLVAEYTGDEASEELLMAAASESRDHFVGGSDA